jgi:hypothetical protein
MGVNDRLQKIQIGRLGRLARQNQNPGSRPLFVRTFDTLLHYSNKISIFKSFIFASLANRSLRRQIEWHVDQGFRRFTQHFLGQLIS